MSIQQIDNIYKSMIPRIGRNAIAAIYPKDFELYITALELVNATGDVVEYFIFPINPVSIVKMEPQLTNIVKTAGGVVSTSIQTFIPCDITMQGNFGKKFKFLVGQTFISFQAFSMSEIINKNISGANNQIFSDTIKTGYGCIKILQRIIQKHNQLDNFGVPYTLNLYNLSLGESYIVKVINQPTFTMSMDKNMIWEYSIQFKALAPLDQMSSDPSSLSNLKLLAASTIQKGVNEQLNNIIDILS